MKLKGSFILGVLCWLICGLSHANMCLDIFTKPDRPYQFLENKPIELSPEQRQILRNHPFAKLLRSGRIRSIEVTPSLYEQSAHIIQGEFIQAVYLKKLIEAAGFSHYLGPQFYTGSPRQGDLKFSVSDSYEFGGEGHPRHGVQTVEMVDLKVANGVFKTPRPEKRIAYKLPRNEKIGHLYINDPIANWRNDPTQPKYLEVVHKMLAMETNIVILSSNNITNFEKFMERAAENTRTDPRGHFDLILPLSEVMQRTQPLPSGRKILIVNDTMGRMPEIHSFSDYAVIVGPKNFFEALYEGIPTYFVINDTVRFNYSMGGLNKMIAVGESFPNFVHLKSHEDLVDLPALRQGTYDNTAFKDLLDILYQKSQQQIADWQ